MDPNLKERIDAHVARGRHQALTYLGGLGPESPLFPMGRGDGTFVRDEYGETYLDFSCGDKLLFGHRDHEVSGYLLVQIQHHTYQAPYGEYQDRQVSELAELLAPHFNLADGAPRQSVFVSSLYEARMMATQLCVLPPNQGAYILSLLDAEGIPREGGEVQDEVHKARAQGLKIVAYEATTGFGRTGTFCLCEQYHIDPDMAIFGDAGTAGLPWAAVVASHTYFQGPRMDMVRTLVQPNPNSLACAAGVAIVSRITPELMQHVKNVSEVFANELSLVCGQFDHILTGTAGVGLVRTIRLNAPSRAAEFRNYCRNAGLLIAPDLRLIPPLNVTEHQVRTAVDAIASACIDMGEVL